MPHCPQCEQELLLNAPECPGCSFTLESLDSEFGGETVYLDRLTDERGLLRRPDRVKVNRALNRFERQFPQLFLAVYVGALPRTTNVRQFAFWLLNRAAIASVDLTRPNAHGALLVIDTTSSTATLTTGYFLEPYLTGADLAHLVHQIRPALEHENYRAAIVGAVRSLSRELRKRSRAVRRHPEKFAARVQPPPERHGLRPIRGGHRLAEKVADAEPGSAASVSDDPAASAGIENRNQEREPASVR